MRSSGFMWWLADGVCPTPGFAKDWEGCLWLLRRRVPYCWPPHRCARWDLPASLHPSPLSGRREACALVGRTPPSFPSPLHQKPSSSSPQRSVLTLGHSSGQGIPALLRRCWVLALGLRPSPATLFSFSILSFSGQLISLKVSPARGLEAVFSVYAINLLPSIVHLVGISQNFWH